MFGNHHYTRKVNSVTEQEFVSPAQLYDAAAGDEDFIRCMRYIEIREKSTPRPTVQQAAKLMGCSERMLFYYIQRWENSGLLRRCRQAFVTPMVEEIRIAESDIIHRWPEVLERQLKTAISSRSDKIALEAAAWINETVIVPFRETKPDTVSEEMLYLERLVNLTGSLDPMSIDSGYTPAEPGIASSGENPARLDDGGADQLRHEDHGLE